MQVIEVTNPGKSSGLVVKQRDIPSIHPDEVLIRVRSAGINRADLLQRRGLYPPPPGASDLLGLEVAGEVVEVGSQVTSIKPSDQVCALLEGGGYAEYVAVRASQVLPIPKFVTLEQAAGLPEVCATAWYNLVTKAKLQEGQSVLIHGAAGGVGSMAVQLAINLGAKVYATVGSEEKQEFVRQWPVEVVVNYYMDNLKANINKITKHQGVDVILDVVGGRYLSMHLNCLRPYGRLVTIALQGGKEGDLNMAQLLGKNLTLMGTILRSQPTSVKASLMKELQSHIWPQIETGKIRPVVDRVFSFNQVQEAHEYMEKSVHKGKILLRWE